MEDVSLIPRKGFLLCSKVEEEVKSGIIVSTKTKGFAVYRIDKLGPECEDHPELKVGTLIVIEPEHVNIISVYGQSFHLIDEGLIGAIVIK
jgi:hypothetical protein